MPSPMGSAASVSQWPMRSRYTPAGDRRSSQRASSPSPQSRRIWTWMSATARSSAIEGRAARTGISATVEVQERAHVALAGREVELEVLQDRVAVGPRRRSVHDGLGELL